MVATSFDAEREYDGDRFTARTVHESDRAKVVLGFFEPDQFIPVHAPDSDVAITVRRGAGTVRDGDDEHAVEPGDVIAVPAGEDRGVRAEEGRLEATLVTAPPPGEPRTNRSGRASAPTRSTRSHRRSPPSHLRLSRARRGRVWGAAVTRLSGPKRLPTEPGVTAGVQPWN